MFSEINLSFINKTSIPPNIALEGYRIKMANNHTDCNCHCDCRDCNEYECNCDCDCACDCESDCDCYDCNDDCSRSSFYNPYDLEPEDYEAWVDSLDD